MSEERDQLLGHADENDGIEEYDNPLPDWWVGLFLFTIVWGIGYAVDYHFISERSQAMAYEKELAQAEEKWPQQEAAVDMSEEALAEGAEIYAANCVGCHSADLTGGIGPNLVDDEWIHGGSFDEVVHVITEGVPQKGMLAWGPILGPQKVSKVASYVLSKGGTAEGEQAFEGTPAEVEEADGEKVFQTHCVACHGPDLTGTAVAPSLVDDEWVHGSSREAIEDTVNNGVPGKAMVAWKPILSEAQIDAVVDYILEQQEGSPQGQ